MATRTLTIQLTQRQDSRWQAAVQCGDEQERVKQMNREPYTTEHGRTFIPICVWTRDGQEIAELEFEKDEHYWLKCNGKEVKLNPWMGHYWAIEECEKWLRFFMSLEREDFVNLDPD